MNNSFDSLEQIEAHNAARKMRWTVRWTFQDKEYMDGYEFHIKAIEKQLALEALGIDSIIECAR